MELKLVECTKEYWEFIRTLRNDERVLEGFIHSIPITKDMQTSYMNIHNKDYWVALLNNDPVGYVGVIDDDIRVCTHPDYQGKGIGKFMINELIKIKPTSFARVKLHNTASIKLFESCGFTKKFYILTRD